MQGLIKTGLVLDFLRLIPIGFVSCLAVNSLAPSFMPLHVALAIGEVIAVLCLIRDHHSKSAWAISLLLHLYEAAFWCFAFWEEGLDWVNGAVFPLPPFFMFCLTGYVLYQYYGYEKARKFHSAV